MPTFTVKAPNGRTVTITGDQAPSEAELDQIFQTAGVSSAQKSAPSRAPGLATVGEQIGGKLGVGADVVTGALKGVGNTVFGLGKMVRDYTPVGRISDAILPGAFDQVPVEIQPSNTAQRVGFASEQVGEFLIPSTAITKLGKVGAVARSAAQTLTQGGGTGAAVLSGGLTAVLPGASAAASGASAFRESAEKTMAQALGATKEKFKAEAAKLAPQMLERGIGGSRKAMLTLAKDTAKSVGQVLDDAYEGAAAAGETINGQYIRGALQLTRDALQVKNAKGALTAIPGSERVIQRLGQLDEFVQSLGDDIPVDRAAKIKRTMDKIIDKAGLFGAKATSSATDNADAWALREASGSFRELLNRNPTIAELNKELSFWVGLKGVLKETQKRTQSQRGGLIDAVRGTAGATAGATVGAAVGGPAGAAVGAMAGPLATQALSKAWNSPTFKTRLSGPAKNLLADALASGSTSRILGAVNKIAASAPAQAQ